MHALVAKIEPDKVLRWCRDGDFLRYFCILHFQGAACSTDLHSKFALRAVRLGEEKRRRKKCNIRICSKGGHSNIVGQHFWQLID